MPTSPLGFIRPEAEVKRAERKHMRKQELIESMSQEIVDKVIVERRRSVFFCYRFARRLIQLLNRREAETRQQQEATMRKRLLRKAAASRGRPPSAV